MAIRLAYAAIAGLSLCACTDNVPTLIAGSGPVMIVQSTYVSSGDSRAALGAGPITYVVAKIELTNDLSARLVPVIAHFFLTDRTGDRYYGIDSGASALAGIANDTSAMKPGEKRTFVVAFRSHPTTMGTVRYDY